MFFGHLHPLVFIIIDGSPTNLEEPFAKLFITISPKIFGSESIVNAPT